MMQHLCLTARLEPKWTVDLSSYSTKNNKEKTSTYILVGGLVERDQVGMEASQSHHWPQGEETHQHLQHSELQLRKQ